MAKTILSPTLREKKRYVLFEVTAKQKQNSKQVEEAIWTSCLSWMGQKGTAQAGVQFIKEQWDNEKQTGVIRVEHLFVNDLKTAIMLTKNIGNDEVMVRSLNTSGIVKKISG